MNGRDVMLIGPTGGKSTVGDLLAKHLAVPLISLDRVRYEYYAELEYDADKARLLRKRNFEELIPYWQPFDAYTVTRTLADFELSSVLSSILQTIVWQNRLFTPETSNQRILWPTFYP